MGCGVGKERSEGVGKGIRPIADQALRKAKGAVQGTASNKVNWIARVEDVATFMDNNQARFVGRQVEDPSKLADIMPGGSVTRGCWTASWQRKATAEGGMTKDRSGFARKGRRMGSCLL